METPHISESGAWLIAFALTLASELAAVGWLARRLEPHTGRRLALCTFANLATHPLVWFFFPAVLSPWVLATLVSEVWAWLVEAAFYRLTFPHASWRASLLLSLAANLTSFGLGLVLWAIGVWP
jgi:hypothetical protein